MSDFDFASFHADEVDTSRPELEPIPEGAYECVVANTEMTPTKKGDGSYLHVEFAVISGQFENRRIFANLNLVNPSKKAEEIGRKELAKIQKAIGRCRIQSHEELRDVPLLVKVGVRRQEGYKPQNEALDYYPVENAAQPAPANQPPVAQPAPAPAPAAQPAAAPAAAPAPAAPANPAASRTTPPWKRK